MLPVIQIPRIEPVSKQDFFELFVNTSTPVVITNLVENWDALERWTFEYIGEKFGDVTAGVLELENGIVVANTQQGSRLNKMTVAECMKHIYATNLNGGYVLSSPVEEFLDALKNDYYTPPYLEDAAFLRSRLFVGPTGTIAPLHQDLPENLYFMVRGVKRITIFPPMPTWRYYPNSRFSKLPNHSKVDIENIDYIKFPRMRFAQPYSVDLVSGEALFLPSFWWHHLRNLEPSVAINFWWSGGWKLPIAWGAAMYKKIRDI
jgi:hypothetical protein